MSCPHDFLCFLNGVTIGQKVNVWSVLAKMTWAKSSPSKHLMDNMCFVCVLKMKLEGVHAWVKVTKLQKWQNSIFSFWISFILLSKMPLYKQSQTNPVGWWMLQGHFPVWWHDTPLTCHILHGVILKGLWNPCLSRPGPVHTENPWLFKTARTDSAVFQNYFNMLLSEYIQISHPWT